MDSTRDEVNEYSSIECDYLVVEQKSTNVTSKSQLRSSERNTYEEPSSSVTKCEQKMLETGETPPLVKNKEKKYQKSRESTICSIKCGLLILFILLTSTLLLLFCLYYPEIMKLLDRELKAQKVDEEMNKLKKNASTLSETINEREKTISEKEAVIANRDVDINRLINKMNELAPEHTSVMLLGGWHDGITNLTTIYNSMEKSWKNCKLTLPSTLGEHGAAIINDEIYIFGGYGNGTLTTLNSLYKLGAENKWERMADMNEKRRSISQSSVVFNSEIWVIGGWDGTDFLKSVEKYNPKTNKWTKMPELKELKSDAAATVVDGKIYVSGGLGEERLKNSVEVYDPEKEKWEIFTPSMPYAVASHILIGNHSHLIAIGGDLSGEKPTNRVCKIDVLDPKKEWKEMPDLRQGRYHSGAAIIADRLMVFGGSISFAQQIDSVEIFDGVEWKNEANLPYKRSYFASIPLTRAQEKLFLKRYCQNS